MKANRGTQREKSMSSSEFTVVGVDVGGEFKGFHAVALNDRSFEAFHSTSPEAVLEFTLRRKAAVVAIDAPCNWSRSGASREAERELARKRISCFATPSEARVRQGGFYQWMLNGESLYRTVEQHYPLFSGNPEQPCCIETFPHAVVCFLGNGGHPVSARPKSKIRRAALEAKGFETACLRNIDFVDAALCAVTANYFLCQDFQKFGNPEEGFIVVPIK